MFLMAQVKVWVILCLTGYNQDVGFTAVKTVFTKKIIKNH
jgi:hypothetical protein